MLTLAKLLLLFASLALIIFVILSGKAPVVGIALLFLFAFVGAYLNSPNVIGRYGERKVRNKIESFTRKNAEYSAFHNLTLGTLDGTTQVDHIVISPYGIFVIETKNYQGWIFGGEKQKKWTQVLYRKKSTFQNPLHQNYKHIKTVQTLLGVKTNQITSIVVFVGNSRFKTEMPYNVLVLRELIPFIKSYNQKIIDMDNLSIYARKLGNPTYVDPLNKEIHLDNVKQNRDQPICPRCGRTMVIRKASRGRNAGKHFWGCSAYPSCKATKTI